MLYDPAAAAAAAAAAAGGPLDPSSPRPPTSLRWRWRPEVAGSPSLPGDCTRARSDSTHLPPPPRPTTTTTNTPAPHLSRFGSAFVGVRDGSHGGPRAPPPPRSVQRQTHYGSGAVRLFGTTPSFSLSLSSVGGEAAAATNCL